MVLAGFFAVVGRLGAHHVENIQRHRRAHAETVPPQARRRKGGCAVC